QTIADSSHLLALPARCPGGPVSRWPANRGATAERLSRRLMQAHSHRHQRPASAVLHGAWRTLDERLRPKPEEAAGGRGRQPHALRRTHADELANKGTRLHVIQQQWELSSLATTDRYIRHLNPQQVVEAMRERTWSA